MAAYMEATLGELCVHQGNSKRNNFNVMDKDGVQPVKVEVSATARYNLTCCKHNVLKDPRVAGSKAASQSRLSNRVNQVKFIGLINHCLGHQV